jgi:ADP-ribose pyrophosphatase YjhB (NUDIX family)
LKSTFGLEKSDMDKIRVGSAALVIKGDKLLLGKRGKEPGYGALVIPGGGVDMYEDFKNTAVREIKEEAGIDINIVRQLGAYQMIRPELNEHRVIIFWIADWIGLDPKPSSDLLSAKFYTREEILAEVEQGNINEFAQGVLRDAGWL